MSTGLRCSNCSETWDEGHQCPLKPGDPADVRVMRWNGSFVSGHVDARETWIPGTVARVDDTTVDIFIHEAAERRTYPIESKDWRRAKP